MRSWARSATFATSRQMPSSAAESMSGRFACSSARSWRPSSSGSPRPLPPTGRHGNRSARPKRPDILGPRYRSRPGVSTDVPPAPGRPRSRLPQRGRQPRSWRPSSRVWPTRSTRPAPGRSRTPAGGAACTGGGQADDGLQRRRGVGAASRCRCPRPPISRRPAGAERGAGAQPRWRIRFRGSLLAPAGPRRSPRIIGKHDGSRFGRVEALLDAAIQRAGTFERVLSRSPEVSLYGWSRLAFTLASVTRHSEAALPVALDLVAQLAGFLRADGALPRHASGGAPALVRPSRPVRRGGAPSGHGGGRDGGRVPARSPRHDGTPGLCV